MKPLLLLSLLLLSGCQKKNEPENLAVFPIPILPSVSTGYIRIEPPCQEEINALKREINSLELALERKISEGDR